MRKLKITPRTGLVILAIAAVVGPLLALRPKCIELGPAELLSIPVADLGPGEARTFCYNDRTGEKIRFILARGSDGKIRSVFDACRQCYSSHKGYKLTAGAMVCRLCGNRYPIDHMMEGKASCMPVDLPHQEQAGIVQVKAADLRKGRELF